METPDAALDAARLGEAAAGLCPGIRCHIEVRQATSSTNDDIRVLADRNAPEGTVVFAEEQLAGRGRRGNAWLAPPRRCLLFSILLRPRHDTALWPRVTHLAALASCHAVDPLLHPAAPAIKWPNDVLVSGRKLCGILLESAASQRGGYLILGVGINVNLRHCEFPGELATTATSLLAETGMPADRTALALEWLRAFLALYPGGIEPFDPALEQLRRRSSLMGRDVTLTDGGRPHHGRVTGFGPSGELRLLQPGGEETLFSSGELVRTC